MRSGSAKPVFELAYGLEAADLLFGVELTPGALAARLRWPVLAVIVLASVIVEWVRREPDEAWLGAIAVLGVSALVFWVPGSQRHSRVRRAFRAMPEATRKLELRLFADKLRVEDGEGRAVELGWADVTAAVRHPGGIWLYVGLRTFVLPARALRNVDEVAAFLRDALGARFHRRPVVLDWEMAANLGIWLAAAVAGVMYALGAY